jgi:hypothetical protein
MSHPGCGNPGLVLVRKRGCLQATRIASRSVASTRNPCGVGPRGRVAAEVDRFRKFRHLKVALPLQRFGLAVANDPGVLARRKLHRSGKAVSKGLHFPAGSLPLRRAPALAGTDSIGPRPREAFMLILYPRLKLVDDAEHDNRWGASLTASSSRDPEWISTAQRLAIRTMSGGMPEALDDSADCQRISARPRPNHRPPWKAAIQ